MAQIPRQVEEYFISVDEKCNNLLHTSLGFLPLCTWFEMNRRWFQKTKRGFLTFFDAINHLWHSFLGHTSLGYILLFVGEDG